MKLSKRFNFLIIKASRIYGSKCVREPVLRSKMIIEKKTRIKRRIRVIVKTYCSVLRVRPQRKNVREKSGGDGIEEPPVPTPNTEVKLNSVDGTWRVTSRESRTLPDYDIPR